MDENIDADGAAEAQDARTELPAPAAAESKTGSQRPSAAPAAAGVVAAWLQRWYPTEGSHALHPAPYASGAWHHAHRAAAALAAEGSDLGEWFARWFDSTRFPEQKDGEAHPAPRGSDAFRYARQAFVDLKARFAAR